MIATCPHGHLTVVLRHNVNVNLSFNAHEKRQTAAGGGGGNKIAVIQPHLETKVFLSVRSGWVIEESLRENPVKLMCLLDCQVFFLSVRCCSTIREGL